MPLPESVPVRYTEEDAGYVTVRPIVRQTFRFDDLLDMVLSVTGKDLRRVKQILRSGTVVYHFYRYTWAGFEGDDPELAAALSRFPDADPARPFSPHDCTTALFESGGVNPRPLLELSREAGSKRRLFRGQSFWSRLLEIAAQANVRYQNYSYDRRADVHRLALGPDLIAAIANAAERLAPRSLQDLDRVLAGSASILFVCRRHATRPAVVSDHTER